MQRTNSEYGSPYLVVCHVNKTTRSELGRKWFLELLEYKKIRGKWCASNNRFVHLLGMHWIFGSRKYMAHRPAQQCSCCPSLIRHHCDAPLYHSAQLPLMLTGKAESAHIMRRQRKVCKVRILVPVCSRAAVLWHAVQLDRATLVKSSQICSTLCSAHIR